MEPIRVLHENVIMDVGGIECLLMNIYRNIDRNKVQFDFMVHRDKEGYFDKEIESLGGRIYHCKPFNPFKHNEYLESMEKVFREHPEYKIVHAHSELNMWPLRLAKQAQIPIRIAHSHNTKETKDLKWLFMQYEKLSLKKYCTHLFACSAKAGEWLYGSETVKDNKVYYLKNGIISDKYHFSENIRVKYRRELHISDKYIVGHIGRFARQKNHMFLMDVFKAVHDKNPNSVLMLVGDGELRKQVENRAKQMGLWDNVIFAGLRSDVPELLQAMDVFVLPSFYEGFPIAAVEAQASGLPCILSDSITQEIKITDLIRSVSLSSAANQWASTILKYQNGFERMDTIEQIKKAGYDIRETAKKLEEFYLAQCKNN